MKSVLTLLLLLLSAEGKVEINNLAEVYRKNSHIQSTSGKTFLEKYRFRGDENILDIGCGDGRLTQFIGTKVPNGSIKGIDISRKMIVLATKSFPEISFECIDALSYHTQVKYDVITCLSTLHWFLDQKTFFQKVKKLLNTGGKIFILAYSPVDSYWKPIEDTISSPKWNKLLDQNQFYCQLRKEELIKTIQESGLSILSFTSIPNTASFTKQSYTQHIRGFLPHLEHLPPKHHNQFLTDLGSNFLKHNPLDTTNTTHLTYESYEIILSLM